jgi:hypothetical protein
VFAKILKLVLLLIKIGTLKAPVVKVVTVFVFVASAKVTVFDGPSITKLTATAILALKAS